MRDAKAAARAVVEIFVTGDVGAVVEVVAERRAADGRRPAVHRARG